MRYAKLPLTCLIITAMFAVLIPALAQDATDETESFGLTRYEGNGFSLLLPPNATVNEVSETEVQILGPELGIRPVDIDFSVFGPAYELTITISENPEGLTAEGFARDLIATEYAARTANNEPTGGLPVGDDGEIFPEAVENVTVAGLPAFKINYFNFDSNRPTFFIAHGERIYTVSYIDYPVENQPIAMVQNDVYALMLATLEFTEE